MNKAELLYTIAIMEPVTTPALWTIWCDDDNPGSAYNTLHRLQDEGLIVSEEVEVDCGQNVHEHRLADPVDVLAPELDKRGENGDSA